MRSRSLAPPTPTTLKGVEMAVIKGGNIIAGSSQRPYKLSGAGAPTVNVTGLGASGVGDEYVDITAGKLYICTATNGTSTITWTVVGTQV